MPEEASLEMTGGGGTAIVAGDGKDFLVPEVLEGGLEKALLGEGIGIEEKENLAGGDFGAGINSVGESFVCRLLDKGDGVDGVDMGEFIDKVDTSVSGGIVDENEFLDALFFTHLESGFEMSLKLREGVPDGNDEGNGGFKHS
jgi:hypothetical protein